MYCDQLVKPVKYPLLKEMAQNNSNSDYFF